VLIPEGIAGAGITSYLPPPKGGTGIIQLLIHKLYFMKKTVSRAKSKITVAIARFTESPVEITLPKSASVQDALDKAKKTLGSSETMWVNGEEAETQDELENGDLLQIVSSKSGGL